MSIKQSQKALQRNRSKTGHLLKKLHREERQSKKLIKLKPIRETSRMKGFILIWVAFAGFAVLLGSSAVAVQSPIITVKHAQNANTNATERDLCGLDSLLCPDEPEVIAESMLAGSPMAGMGKMIVDTATEYDVSWELIIGIADAESTLGRYFYYEYDKDNCFNVWGISANTPTRQREDGSWLRCFNDWQSGINTISSLLSRKYNNQTPEEMVGTYVGWDNKDWVNTVNKYVL